MTLTAERLALRRLNRKWKWNGRRPVYSATLRTAGRRAPRYPRKFHGPWTLGRMEEA